MNPGEEDARLAVFCVRVAASLDERVRATLFAAIVQVGASDAGVTPRELLRQMSEASEWGSDDEWIGELDELERAVRNARRWHGRPRIQLTTLRRQG